MNILKDEFDQIILTKYRKTNRLDWMPYYYNKCKDVLPYKNTIDNIISNLKLTGIIEYFYLLLNKISDPPKCPYCSNKRFFGKFGKGYGTTCGSRECKNITITKRMTGRMVSEQTREKISRRHKGRIISTETKQKLSLAHMGKKLSIETKKKMSESHEKLIKENPDRLIYLQKLSNKNRQLTLSEASKKKRTDTLMSRYGIKNSYNLSKVKNYSKVSQELFFLLKPLCVDECYFAENNGEKMFKYTDCSIKPDFVYKNLIIEFYGDIYHANPRLYNENDTPNIYHRKKKAYTIWEEDLKKNSLLRGSGYTVLIVWEHDYKMKKNEIINRLKEEIKCLNK